MIQAVDLCLTLPGGRRLFDGLNWQVPDGARTALVGANGVGKTTLLRTIVGQVSADSGEIRISPSGATVGYLPQDLAELPPIPLMEYLKERTGLTEAADRLKDAEARMGASAGPDDLNRHARLQAQYERLGGYEFESMAAKTLGGLGFRPGDAGKRCSDFSGGWKMRISLAALLLCRPDHLLLDEPTNHLDTESMEWLESWLSGYDGTMVAISHDRFFMDKIVTSVAHLKNGRLTCTRGNFSDYLAISEAQAELLAKQAKRQRAEMEHLQSYVERFRYKASKATQAQSRIKRLEQMEPVQTVQKERTVSMRFPDCRQSGRVVLKAENLAKEYDEPVFSGLTFEILRGDKVALVGVNGAGKSTLSRLLAGVEKPSGGSVTLGHGVEAAYFSQSSSENLCYENTVWQEAVSQSPDWTQGQRHGLLGCFLFGPDDLEKRVAVLSGGEKSRLALAKILMKPSNFLILDEPTNHLDMVTRELFQQAVLAYSGTLLIVSHDRYFLNLLADRVLEIRDHRLFDYQGNYSWYIAARERQMAAAEASSPAESAADRNDRRARRREEGERRNEIYRRKKEYAAQLAELEKDIAADEALIAELDGQLCDPSVIASGTKLESAMIGRAQAVSRLEERMSRWESLMEIIGAIEAGKDPAQEERQ